jgi:Tol biopolymer transport system component/DNA-binding winged helix-turn-helix (wHTH) protein
MPADLHFSIGEWTIQPELNAISKGSATIHLEPKVMKVLLQLAISPGQVLTKEHLIQSVWPETFVSDDVLTRCISVLRREMQDDTHAPRYIQTIPKAGYRLVAQVHRPNPPSERDSASSPTLHQESAPSSNHAEETSVPEPLPQPAKEKAAKGKFVRGRWSVVVASIALIAAAVLGVVTWRVRSRPPAPAFRVIPLTSYAGQQDQASFSPGGSRVAFIWSSPDNGDRNLFIKQTGSETVLRLTHGSESEYSPVWSPDGTKIAYLAVSGKGLGIYVVSSLGGPAQKLYSPQGMVHWEQRALSWSPDGKSLVFPDGAPPSINVLSLDTLQAHAITTPPHVWDGDANPVYSPDGSQIAFIRAIEGAVRDIYVMPAAGGAPRQITHDRHIVDSLTWTRDGRAIVFSSDRGGKFALWQVALRGGEPQRLPVGTEDAYQPAISPVDHALLYTASSATWSILGFRLHTNGEAGRHREALKPAALVSSTEQDSAPSFAPDGSRFAFQSWRSGAQELWIASRDGLTLRQLTWSGRGLTGSPSFSPDGQQVAYDARPEGHSHIFVVSANSGPSRELTTGNSNDILPRWSADGKFIYFASNRSGTWQSWKVALQGGQPKQVTFNDGYLAMESPDGQWLYYARSSQPGVWRIPVGGGSETRVLPQPPDGFWGYWAVTAHGIYYLDATQPVWRIQLYDPATQKTSLVTTLERHPPPYSGISVDRNEDELLITDEGNASSHITLVQNLP